MRFKSLCLLFFSSLGMHAQHTHHVYSTEAPWLRLDVDQVPGRLYSINEAMRLASPGDSIVIHEGIYREKLTVSKNNLVFCNYQDDYVLITGTEKVSRWQEAPGMSAGVMMADLSSFPMDRSLTYTQLFANGERQLMARHPNNSTGDMLDPLHQESGYGLFKQLRKDAGANAKAYATFSDEVLLPDVDLTNGIIRGLSGKNREYFFGQIQSNSGNGVTFKGLNNGPWKDAKAIQSTYHKFAWGFIFHKNLLDVPGEWFVENKKLYYMPPADADIEDLRVEVQVRERVLELTNRSQVTFKGLHFIAGNMKLTKTTQTLFEDCSIRHLTPFWIPKGYGQNDSRIKGIYLEQCSNNTFRNVYAAHAWGNLFALSDGANNVFDNCVMKDYGWIAIFTSGVFVARANNTRISKCTFADGGRFHIRVSDGNAKVDILDSDFYGAMKMGEDAGPLEATSTGSLQALDMGGSEIAYNKVHDCHGIPVSSGFYNKQKITAFYMEDTQNYTAHHNLIYNMRADTYHGPHTIQREGEFLYLGPRYNPMHKPVNYYNNTIWNSDKNLGIWNIEVDNWKELGLTPPDTSGCMTDGHFANNIFTHAEFGISYVRQILTPTGGNKGYVTLKPSPSLKTHDFEAYVAHCKELNYHFNPQHNLIYSLSQQDLLFEDAAEGDFRLKSESDAKQQGVAIAGITSSATPDCGALEGGDRVLRAGATLVPFTFEEEGMQFIPPASSLESTPMDEVHVYVDPIAKVLHLTFSDIKPTYPLMIFALDGSRVAIPHPQYNNASIQVEVGRLLPGTYLVWVPGMMRQAYKIRI